MSTERLWCGTGWELLALGLEMWPQTIFFFSPIWESHGILRTKASQAKELTLSLTTPARGGASPPGTDN